MLRAEIDGDEAQWRRHLAEHEATGSGLVVMGVAFLMLARRRFEKTDVVREVGWFVSAFNELAPPEERLPPREAEAVLRGALGETRLAAAVDDRLAGKIMYVLLLALVDDLKLGPPAVDRLLLGAEQMVAQVQSLMPEPSEDEPAKVVTIGDGKMFGECVRRGSM